MLGDQLQGLFGRRLAYVGPRSGAETLGDRGSELDSAIGAGVIKGLGIGVGNDEFDAGRDR